MKTFLKIFKLINEHPDIELTYDVINNALNTILSRNETLLLGSPTTIPSLKQDFIEITNPYKEIYSPLGYNDGPTATHPIRTEPKIGRNEICPKCDSGKKYKKCCINT